MRYSMCNLSSDIFEFLDTIEPGLEVIPFMEHLENEIETASDRLMLEAGFDADKARQENRQ